MKNECRHVKLQDGEMSGVVRREKRQHSHTATTDTEKIGVVGGERGVKLFIQ